VNPVNPVMKLGPGQQGCMWIDRDGQAWRWTDAAGWQRKELSGWSGSFATVEGSPPYLPAGATQ
jgi:hypothetical protein